MILIPITSGGNQIARPRPSRQDGATEAFISNEIWVSIASTQLASQHRLLLPWARYGSGTGHQVIDVHMLSEITLPIKTVRFIE
ncbi:hypothetical protein HF909_05565 [Ralstonia pseudosolanacearum]|uniref:Uncharacterized protein n=1 Tax=Ralstonia solanacearum TaxID=305 RepID=A0AA92JZR7_RALSL|nr:hypothetical protein [Ralstonia pseudosolanacearum]QOK95814.1 hypothetical protein HF909_04810 [Ralstonia pseudosolanacearum]QOK95952.1 hypothetical protein HF909_05565 [Ralstonia pseudosolanacearum]